MSIPEITLEAFRASKKILTSEEDMLAHYEKHFGEDVFEDSNRIFPLSIHVYGDVYWIEQDRDDKSFIVEIENWYKQGTLEEMEEILYNHFFVN